MNGLGDLGDSNPLTKAGKRGDLAIAALLLANGAKPYVDASVGNPLFSCASSWVGDRHPTRGKDTPPENYLKFAKMLIDSGIDTTIRYDMSYGPGIDAVMFALIWKREDIAELIAQHQAQGDEVRSSEILKQARESVDALDLR